MQTIDKCFHKEFGSGSRLKYSTSGPPLFLSVSWILFRYSRYCKEDFDVNFSSTSESVRRLRRGNHFWDNLKGHCYECDIENSKLDRYTFFDWKNTGHNGPVFVKDTLYCVLKPRSLNYILPGHMTVHKVMKQIWQTFIRSQGKAKYKFLLLSTLHNLCYLHRIKLLNHSV